MTLNAESLISGIRKWRAATAGIIMVPMLAGIALAQTSPSKTPSATKELRQAAIERKLDEIVLPIVSFEDSSLKDAVDFMRSQCLERGVETEGRPKPLRINFIIRDRAGFHPPQVTLDLRNTSARKTLERIAELTGTRVEVDAFAVSLIPKENATEAIVPVPAAPKGKAMAYAAEVIVPVTDFENSTLEEAISFLESKASRLSKDGKRFHVLLTPKANSRAIIKELRLRDVPLSELVRYCAEAAGEPWSADDEALSIGK